MKTTLTQHEAADMLMKFEAFGTGSDAYNLCYTMAQYLEQYEEDTGEELELDPIAIRCEYRAITLDEAVSDYQILTHLADDADVLEWLNDCTQVIPTDIKDTYIIQEF
jgi:hypothetical protein